MSMTEHTEEAPPARETWLARLAGAALDLAETREWSALRLQDIAAAADTGLSHPSGPVTRDEIALAALCLPDAALAGDPPAPQASVRDQLFDIVMQRYDTMELRRGGYAALLAHLERHPVLWPSAASRRLRTARFALSLAGIEGEAGLAASVWLAGQTVRLDRVWKTEASPDLPRTMAALDRILRDMEDAAGTFGRWTGAKGRRRPEDAPDTGATPGEG